MQAEHAIYLGLCVSALWSIICRINRMDAGTPHWVFFKYFLLGLGLFAAILVPSHRDIFSLLGICCYLGISTKRWDLYKMLDPEERGWAGFRHSPRRLQRLWEWILRN